LGRRIAKSVNNVVTWYVYDGNAIIAAYDLSGTVTARYAHGLNIDEPLAVQRGSATSFYHADGLGSIVALTNAAGSVVQTYSYDSFGNVTPSGGITQPYTYTAREYDNETGLYFYRARYYDSKVGRFVTRDPISFAGGDVNLYGYVRNNPINWFDPFGLAQVGSRPLDSSWVPFNGRGRLRHDQIWYDDDTNSGFFDDDAIRTDRNHTRNDYNFNRDPNHYDDNVMRDAERNVQRNWDMDWRLRNNNCQDYINAVRREYERLRREREKEKCRN